MLKLSLRGLLLLNPFMGVIYFGAWRYRLFLPRIEVGTPFRITLVGGWTEWSELACGLVTATAYAGLVYAVLG